MKVFCFRSCEGQIRYQLSGGYGLRIACIFLLLLMADRLLRISDSRLQVFRFVIYCLWFLVAFRFGFRICHLVLGAFPLSYIN